MQRIREVTIVIASVTVIALIAYFGGLSLARRALSAREPAPSSTDVKVFVPSAIVTDVANPPSSFRKVSGHCWVGAATDEGRFDAWKCGGANEVFDPCFELEDWPHHNRVFCFETPWDESGVTIQLTQDLAYDERNALDDEEASISPQKIAKSIPWAVETVAGDHCVMQSGATSVIFGMRYNYECTDESWIIGDIDREDVRWYSFMLRPGSREIVRVQLRVAWY